MEKSSARVESLTLPVHVDEESCDSNLLYISFAPNKEHNVKESISEDSDMFSSAPEFIESVRREKAMRVLYRNRLISFDVEVLDKDQVDGQVISKTSLKKDAEVKDVGADASYSSLAIAKFGYGYSINYEENLASNVGTSITQCFFKFFESCCYFLSRFCGCSKFSGKICK